MPIKFRCEKCRQFLGISRAQAGEIVDCPTCGRSTRVPQLDGTREPVPTQPGLDKADSSLLNALDQLAALGEKGGGKKPVDDVALSKSVAPVQLSEPIDVDPLEPAEAKLPPPRNGSKLGSEQVSQGDASSDPSANTSVDSAVVLKNLAARAEPQPLQQDAKAGFSLAWLLLSGAFVAAAFGGGWFVGNRSSKSQSQAVGDPRADEPSEQEEVAEQPRNGIAGRITFRKSVSECLPDRGARVIAWPVGLTPEQPWSLDGFRAGDSAELTEAATKQLQEQGGDLAIVDDQGVFRLNLMSGGDYEVLVLSRFGGQSIDSSGISSAHLARLKVCFKEPRRLVGKTQFFLTRMKYRGQGEQLLDHVFEVVE